ncbi:MAG: hypothetical protein GY772_31545, partial [bacterium]|nr:hypothetical protein [bacterium]
GTVGVAGTEQEARGPVGAAESNWPVVSSRPLLGESVERASGSRHSILDDPYYYAVPPSFWPTWVPVEVRDEAEDERFFAASAEWIENCEPIRASIDTLEAQRALRPRLGENAGTETRHGSWRVPAWSRVEVPRQPNLADPRVAVGPAVYGTDADPALIAWRDHAKHAALAVLELCKPEMVSPLLQSGVENFAPMMGGILAQVGVGPLATRLLPDEWATLSVHRGEHGTFQHPLPPRPLDPATAPSGMVTDSALNMGSGEGKTYAGKLIKQWYCPNLNFRYESGATAFRMR